MKQKKKRNNYKKKKITGSNIFQDQFNKDILGAIIIGIGLISLISLFSFKMGLVGTFIRKTTFTLMGFGGYLFPIVIILTGLILILERFNKKERKVNLTVIIIFLSFLILLDGKNIDSKGFIDRLQIANYLSQFNQGGGIIGGFFGFFFYNLFGSIGSYIVITFIIGISILVLTDLKFTNIFKIIKETVKEKDRSNKKDLKTNSKINTKPKRKILEEITEKDSNNIKIMNYSEVKNNTLSNEAIKNSEQLAFDTKINKKQKTDNNIEFILPSIDILETVQIKKDNKDNKLIMNNAKIIEETMQNFGIDARVTQINKGPTITCYELSPAPGIKLSRIVSLSDNIALSLASSDIRIEAPIPGKAAVGIEVPNKVKESVFFKELLLSEEYQTLDSKLPLALGKDVSGNTIVSTIDKMPHLLIAGATGSGKSVCINTIIMNILFRSSPEEVKLLLIDPKVVELSVYNGIPHLLIPVVTDAKKASFALNWAVEEMERRYKLFAKNSVRDIKSYNDNQETMKEEKLPNIVIIIDELADLMMVAAQEIEDYICRLAQMARAAGMYLIVATQRPSVDVITGTIKANIPSRISFAVSSQVDSRTILDMGGAEKLLGKGDMLFYPSSYSKPLRVQGAFITDSEVEKVVNHLKKQNITEYDEEMIEVVENTVDTELEDADSLLPEAIDLVLQEGQASISFLQRRLRVGYARAARLVDDMEAMGVVGGFEGNKPRKVLVSKEDLDED